MFTDNIKKELLKQPYDIQLHPDFPATTIRMYMPPQKNRAYIVGADPSTGTDGDYQALTVWDITNTFNIELVASFYENDIPPKFFAYIICKLASIYNRAYVAIENNGVSYATLEYLWRDFEYDNIIHLGGNPKTSIGIVSNGDRKFDACLNFKEIVEDKLRNIYIYDGRIIDEMERFEKHTRLGRCPAYAASQGNDDLMMASIWAFYVLKPDLIENYYDVRQFANDKLGNATPLFITSSESINDEYSQQFIIDLDKKFKNISNKYEISMNQLEQSVKASQQELMQHFTLNTDNQSQQYVESNFDDNEDSFQFDRIRKLKKLKEDY